jgi:hypothetical protein
MRAGMVAGGAAVAVCAMVWVVMRLLLADWW